MRVQPLGLCVRALIQRSDGQYLIVRRSRAASWQPGRWELPGGKVEVGEPPNEALCREVNEEIGVTPKVLRVIGCTSQAIRQVWVVTVIYSCRLGRTAPTLSNEHSKLQWIDMKLLKRRVWHDL
jgi:8-oxo-dGTP diphosphatase